MAATPSRSIEKFVKQDAQNEANILDVETSRDEILHKIRFAEDLFPDCVVMLCNATHRNFPYISENFTEIFGHSISYFSSISANDFCADVHPDDVQALGSCYDLMIKDTAGLTATQLISTRFVMNYRFRHSSGHYLHIEDEKVIMESRTGKHIGLTLLRDVDREKKFMGVKLRILKRSKRRFVKVNEYAPAQVNTVSSREADILLLAKEGFKNQEIADRLSISINTVKNHKKNLFKKINVRSSAGLMKYAQHNPS